MYSPVVQPGRSRKRFLLPVILALLTAAALFTVLFLWYFLRPHGTVPVSADATPVGEWETPPMHRATGSAQMGFVFRADGTGLFTWQATGAAAGAGQAPLLWSLDTTQRLNIRISRPNPPPSGKAAAGTLIDIFNSHAWLWRADHAQRRLIVGKLMLLEKEK